jgi:predicted nucleic acid-binding protein
MAGWNSAEALVASRIARLEVARTLNRIRLELSLSPAEVRVGEVAFERVAARIDWLPLDDAVLALAAESTPVHLKALDAIHLATARIFRDAPTERLVFATHDRRLAASAREFRFEVAGI